MGQSDQKLPIDYKGFHLRRSNNAFIINGSDSINNAIDIMRTDGLKHLEINANFFNSKDLTFIEQFSFISELSIIGKLEIDLTPINHLQNLRKIIIDHKQNGTIDFTQFPDLEYCYIAWGIHGCETILQQQQLKELTIHGYSAYELFAISRLDGLHSLKLIGGEIVNLKGINSLTKLKLLDLSGCKNLEDINDIDSIPQLEELRLDYCSNIKDFTSISSLIGIKKIAFSNVGDVPSLAFVQNLTALEEIIFTEKTNVVDGDLSYLDNLYKTGTLKKVIFINRKHYSHKRELLGYKIPDSVAKIFGKK